MAKADEIGFLEKHVEKLVLLAGVVLLALCVYRWVLSSPLTFEVVGPAGSGKAEVGPEKADRVLHQAALAIRARIAHYPAVVGPMPKHAGKTADLRLIEPAEANAVALSAPQRPIRPYDANGLDKGGPTLDNIVKSMLALPELTVTATEVVPEKEQAADTILARGELVFPLARQLQEWQAILPQDRVRPALVVHDVIVRVQELLPGGQWSEAKKVTPSLRPLPKPATTTAPAPEAPVEIPAFDGSNHAAVHAAVRALAEEPRQRRITRGDYYRVWSPEGDWQDLRAAGPEEPPKDELRIAFHDDATMKPGRTYRYSVQLELVSPLLAHDDVVARKNADDAKAKYIQTKFSDWSAPVSVGKPVDFFVTGIGMNQQVKARVFTRVLNQVVSQEFNLAPGDPIGGPSPVKVYDPVAKGARNVMVDFRSGCTTLDFRFDMQAARGALVRNTFMLLYLDAQGQVSARYLAWDQESDQYKAWRDAGARAPAGAAAGAAAGTGVKPPP
jgi:hypothetical protein